MAKDQYFSELLNKKKLKKTTKRLDILSVFQKGCKPINAQFIYKVLKNKKIDLTTIYRTLLVFEKVGILKRVDLQQDSVFYELNGDHHHHIICLKCKKISNFEGCQKDADSLIQKALKNNKNFSSISHHSFDLFGFCKKCSLIKIK